MRRTKNLMLIIIICSLGCSKEKNSSCVDITIEETMSLVLGEYEEYGDHLEAIDLGNELCLVAGDVIKCLPYDTTEEKYVLSDQFNINGIVITEFDTIVQKSNSFYRFFPSIKQFEFIYSPPYTIHNFRVTPNNGIGYFWGNVFVEPLKFNYFDFSTKQNKTIFQYSKFIQDSLGPVYQYQTYLENNILQLLMRTGNNSNSLSTTGVFYKIQINELEILKRKEYKQKNGLKIWNYLNFDNILVKYGNNGKQIVSNYNWETNESQNSFSFPASWLETSYYISEECLSIAYHSISENYKLQFINWMDSTILFDVPLHEDYWTAFVETYHYKNEYVVLFEKKGNTALIYDRNGCVVRKLLAKSNIEEVLLCDENKIIIMNDLKEIEYFQID